jgi:hypothetical protein
MHILETARRSDRMGLPLHWLFPMTLDDALIIEHLDEHWRDLAQIRNRLRKNGIHARQMDVGLPASLLRLANAGQIERKTIKTTAPRPGRKKGTGNYAIEYFRRIG